MKGMKKYGDIFMSFMLFMVKNCFPSTERTPGML